MFYTEAREGNLNNKGGEMTILASAPKKQRARTVLRLSEEERLLYKTIPQNIFFVWHPRFDEPTIGKSLFGPDAEIIRIQNWVAPATIRDESTPKRKRTKTLTGEQQTTLFLRYNYASYRLSMLTKKQERHFSLSRVREMIAWHQRALSARADLARANLALVLAMAKRSKFEGVPFDELVSEGNMALLRSVDKFDVSRGFKFSTYACRAIITALRRISSQYWRHQERFPVEFNVDVEKPEKDWERKEEIRIAHNTGLVRKILETNQAWLTDLERKIIDERFFASDGKKRTLAEIGLSVKLSNERVRQILNVALIKIRAALERSMTQKTRRSPAFYKTIGQ